MVSSPGSGKTAILERSIKEMDKRLKVFVIEGDKARARVVKTGNKYGDVVEVIEGVNEKERVVVVGQNNLSEGVKVNVAR